MSLSTRIRFDEFFAQVDEARDDLNGQPTSSPPSRSNNEFKAQGQSRHHGDSDISLGKTDLHHYEAWMRQRN
jgi:hypothetical protein